MIKFELDKIKMLHKRDLKELFPYKQTKFNQFLKSGELPLVWIGDDCIISQDDFIKWYKSNLGNKITL